MSMLQSNYRDPIRTDAGQAGLLLALISLAKEADPLRILARIVIALLLIMYWPVQGWPL